MGLFRTIIFIILVYLIIKALRRIVAPFFAGYHEKEASGQATGRKGNQQRVNKIIIDTSKAKSNLQAKPDISRIDAEDIDFEEVK